LSKISSDVKISRCIFDWELRFLLGGVPVAVFESLDYDSDNSDILDAA
jgi:hypothetical protein